MPLSTTEHKAAPSLEDVPEPNEPLATTVVSEMGQREEWNKKNPPTTGFIVKDLKTTPLVERKYRGTSARFYKLGGTKHKRLQPHLSELPPGAKSVNHRHTTEAVIYIVKGVGHSVISWDGETSWRIDWEEGDLFSFPTWIWHQHFNDSETETCRYLAIQDTFFVKGVGLHAIERAPHGDAE